MCLIHYFAKNIGQYFAMNTGQYFAMNIGQYFAMNIGPYFAMNIGQYFAMNIGQCLQVFIFLGCIIIWCTCYAETGGRIAGMLTLAYWHSLYLAASG